MKQLSKLIPLAVIAAALLVAGCGDDDDETTTSSSTTTPATGSISLEQWITQADQICAQGDRATEQAAQQQFGQEPPSEAELEQFATEFVITNLQSQHDAIAALPMPEAEAEQIEAMLGALQEGIDQVSEDPIALVQGTDSIPGIEEATGLARDLGLTDCGSG